jgi:hypothetical protein
VIRLIKRAFQESGISMPDEAREVIFPQGLTVRREPVRPGPPTRAVPPPPAATSREPEVLSTAGEAGLESEDAQIHEQARRSRSPEEEAVTLDLERRRDRS